MINIKSEQLEETFYKMFLSDILGKSFQDPDKLNGNYGHLDHKMIEKEKKKDKKKEKKKEKRKMKESNEKIANKFNFDHNSIKFEIEQYDQNNQFDIVNEINIPKKPFQIMHSTSYLHQILTSVDFDKNYEIFMHSSHEIALELIEPEKQKENHLLSSKYSEHEFREGVRRRNLIRNFGRKCQTFAKKYGFEMLKLFYKSILGQRANPIDIEPENEGYSIARRFREWISKKRTEMDGLHKLKKVLIPEEEEEKMSIIFKKSLQFVMIYFIKNHYEEWVTSSNLFGNKNIPNDYKQDMESLIRDPINFKWHI